MTIRLAPSWKETLRLPSAKVDALQYRLADRRMELMKTADLPERMRHPAAALYAPSERHMVDDICAFVESFGTPRYVILVGIGGSSLGVEAVYHGLWGEEDPTRTLIVFDALVPERIRTLEERISLENLDRGDIALVIVSKSGTTAETAANAVAVRAALESKFGDLRDRIVAVSDEGTPLEAEARENGWRFFAIPKPIGGRYSIFSAASLVPLGLLGVDVRAFLSGADDALRASWKTPVISDPASSLAAAEYLLHEDGISTEVNMYFAPRLEHMGKWHRQLLSESIGKKKGAQRVGIMPHVAIGSTDLHSIEQLLVDGPRDKYVILHTIKPRESDDSERVYKGKSLAGLQATIVRGLISSYKTDGVLFAQLELLAVTEKSLGAYMMLRMEETILLAHLLGIDPFDQPGVESYKSHVKGLLGSGG